MQKYSRGDFLWVREIYKNVTFKNLQYNMTNINENGYSIPCPADRQEEELVPLPRGTSHRSAAVDTAGC